MCFCPLYAAENKTGDRYHMVSLMKNNRLKNSFLWLLYRSTTSRRLMNLASSGNLLDLAKLGSVLVGEMLGLSCKGRIIRVISDLSLSTFA